MYNCSQAFHNAVANGNEQKALLIFSDCVFTDEDISVDSGIQFHDYFNIDEDLNIGQATSNEITFTLFNDQRLLNNFKFGEFTATLGVLIGKDNYQQYGTVMVNTQYATYRGADVYPFITRNNMPLASQPSFAVKSILAYDGKVYAFSNDGRYVVYNDATGANITQENPVNAFMRNKSIGWQGKGIFYNKNTRILFIYDAGVRKRYEFVPLGVFIANRPKQPDRIQIYMDCFDRMELFDEDMPSADELQMSYPAPIGGLYHQLCSYVGVPSATDHFINADAIIEEEPDDFTNVSMRQVLKWIAEAAGANARFNRDGELELAWVRYTEQSFDGSSYGEFNPYWYNTKQITKLYNRDTAESEDLIVGSGNECYLIQDNPLLKGVS